MNNAPIVFLPGLICDERLFTAHAEALNTETLIMDLRHADSIEQMARQTLHQAPLEFALVGFSMGGYVAFEILRQCPSRVKKLALISTQARVDPPEVKQRRKDLMALASRGKFRGITRQIVPTLIDPSRIHDHELVNTIIEMGQTAGAETFINQEKAILERKESLSLLPHIECPTIILGGQNDQLTEPHCQTEMHRLIPDAKLFLLENTGHLLPLEQLEKSIEILRSWHMC